MTVTGTPEDAVQLLDHLLQRLDDGNQLDSQQLAAMTIAAAKLAAELWHRQA